MPGLGPARTFSVMGAGRSGLAAVEYLMAQGCRVFVSDSCDGERLAGTLARHGLRELPCESGGHTERVLRSDAIILSPGIRPDLPLLDEARRRGIPVWSEIELGFRASAATFCAITGSTGKSTTAAMLGSVLQAAGRESVVAGNIGVPLTAVAPPLSPGAVVVAEVSSFQLQTIDTFRPAVAVFTNLLPNHLDRHADMDEYFAAKQNVMRNGGPDCHLVANARCAPVRSWATSLTDRVHVVFTGSEIEGFDGAWCSGGTIVTRSDGDVQPLLPTNDLRVPGGHNLENACMAAAAAQFLGVESAAIATGLRAFRGLPHRLELVEEANGVRFYNDSKATTGEAVRAALLAFDGGVHLIAGGRDKGCDFAIVGEALARRARQVVLIGEAAARLEREWRRIVPVVRASSLEGAVRAACAHAAPGDAVLLSPGCASFDMFASYEERGEEFCRLVRRFSAGTSEEDSRP